MPSSISVEGDLFGQYIVQYIVVICMLSVGVWISMECCKFFVGLVVGIGGRMSALMLFLYSIATLLSMLFVGCVIV